MLLILLRITLSSAGRKVTWFLWHYSEAPQKARNFLDPLERFVMCFSVQALNLQYGLN